MNVNEIKNILASLVSGEKTGHKLGLEDYNLYLQKANLDLFNQTLKNWEEGQTVTDMLYPFKVKTDLTFAAGVATMPTDYAMWSAVYYDGNFTDWFLPSEDELQLMRTNLYAEDVGGFSGLQYWSSTEENASSAYYLMFSLDVSDFQLKSITDYVRACRSFTAGAGAYSLRDTGPAGGLIFHVDGTTYYEAAPSDQSVSKAWSNITGAAIGTTDSIVGEGQNNTDEIIAQAGHTDSAAKICDDTIISINDTVPIELVTDAELPDRINNAITAPTAAYPIICLYNEQINILPVSITTGVDLLYIKKPVTPAYVWALDAYNRQRYLAADFYTLTVTTSAPTIGHVHQITVNYDGGGAVTICDFTATTIVAQDLAQGMAESVNNLYGTTGYFASVGTNAFTIYLNSSTGVAADYVVAEAGTGVANFVAASPLVDGTGGSVELEWDETEHTDIIRLIIGYTGINIKDSLVIQAIDREKQENIK